MWTAYLSDDKAPWGSQLPTPFVEEESLPQSVVS